MLRVKIVLLVPVLALAFAACGGGGDSPQGSPSPAPTSATPTPPETADPTSPAVPAPVPTGASIAALAASMQPGTWAELATAGFNKGAFLETATFGKSILQWSDKATWDPTSRQFLFLGAPHFEPGKFVLYNDATNTWGSEPLPKVCIPPACIHHGYNHNTVDPGTGHFYYRFFNSAEVYKYNTHTKIWAKLSDISGVAFLEGWGALEFFPEMNGLVYINGDEFTPGIGNVYFFSSATNQWSSIASGIQMGDVGTFAVYNPVHKVMLFGGGGSNIINRLNANGTVTARGPAPISMGNNLSIVTVDPVSGNYLVLGADKSFREYDVMTDVWKPISGTVPVFTSNTPPIFDVVATPVTTYGVVMFVKYAFNESKVYIYKHKPG